MENISENTKSERINLRLQHNAKELLERAAGFEGRSLSQFILSCAIKQAERTIQEHETMILKVNDAEEFINALSKPVEFNDALTAALHEHSSRVISS